MNPPVAFTPATRRGSHLSELSFRTIEDAFPDCSRVTRYSEKARIGGRLPDVRSRDWDIDPNREGPGAEKRMATGFRRE